MTDDEKAQRFAEAAFAAAGRGPLTAGECAEDMNRPFIHPRYGRAAPRMKPVDELPTWAQDRIRRDLQSKYDGEMMAAMLPGVRGGTTTSCAGKPFTMDDLNAAMERLAVIPPLPFFGSSKRFPADHFVRFNHKGQDHLLAHPDCWKQVLALLPVREAGVNNPFTSLEVVDLDSPIHEEKLSELAEELLDHGCIV